MVIGHDNRGPDPSWLLEEVHVDIPSRNEHYVFRCGKWLRINNGKDETETVLYPGTYVLLCHDDDGGGGEDVGGDDDD